MQAIVPTWGWSGLTVGYLGVAPGQRTLTLGLSMTDDEFKRRIAYAIRSAREERGLSRPQLADAVGIGRGAVSDWENGETLPSLLNIGPLCDALGVEADMFAHPPAIPVSSVRPYLREVAEHATDYEVTDRTKEPRREAGAGGNND